MRKLNLSKSVAAVLSAALLAMSLTACGSTASTASTAASEAASTAASTEAASEASASVEEVLEEVSTEVEVDDEEDSEEASEAAVTEDDEEEAEDENNTDITAGTKDEDGNYTAYAVLGGKVDASVSALAEDIKTDDFSSSKAIEDKGSTAIKDARLKFLTAENDGDEDAAKDDLADYEDVESASDSQLKEIKTYAEDLGKLFTQFDITAYDLSSPYDSDSEYVEYDVYSSAGKRFMLDFYFTDGALSSFELAEEEE